MDHAPDIESLREEFCPPLDEALFFALALDFDISNQSQATELRKALESLKEGAVEEQELELLPPVIDHPHPNVGLQTNGSNATDAALSSRAAEDEAHTSITTGLSSFGISESTSQDHDGLFSGYGEAGEAFENLSQEEKVHWLMNMFPSVPKLTIEKVLTKCEGQFDRSTDELLTESFFKDSGIDAETQHNPIVKGIEAFASNDREAVTKKRGKGRNRRARNPVGHDAYDELHSDSHYESSTSTPNPYINIWAAAPKDIEFLTSRTELTTKTITSIYHANGARLAPTIRAILTREASTQNFETKQVDEVIQWQIDELRTYFENIPDSLLHAALMLTRRSPSAAKELLDAMMTSSEQPTVIGKVDGLATYAPLDISDGETSRKTKRAASQWGTVTSSGTHTVSHLANPHGLAATNAFNQASAAHKKGKSDRLMGGAAAYYASVGHEHLKAAKASQASEAEAHVARQSSPSTLDLHGINVSHAVRIAKDATETWWDSLGDRKYIPSAGVGSGYRIVTGIGRHSADGVGRIGPAVSKMLVREGWKVEVDQGQIIIWGRVRKK